MDEKIITILLISAIVISIFSIVITLNLNLEYSQLSAEQMMVQKEDFSSANVGLVIEEPVSLNIGGEDE